MARDYLTKEKVDGAVIGRSDESKIGFYGATPVVQQEVNKVTINDANSTYTQSTTGELGLLNSLKDELNDLIDALVASGIVHT